MGDIERSGVDTSRENERIVKSNTHDNTRFCWFHEFDHAFDGVSDGWVCHAWGPCFKDGVLTIGQTWEPVRD